MSTSARPFPSTSPPARSCITTAALAWVPRRELARRVPRLLDELGLADRAGEPIAAFSKGMFQRLALAQALVNEPELLVLDEPAEGMDLAARKLMYELIDRHKAAGKTAILVSHNMADVARLCDQAAVLRDGRLAFTGLLADLLAGTVPIFGQRRQAVGTVPIFGQRREASARKWDCPLWLTRRGKKGTVPICRNGPKGARHKWGLSPFSCHDRAS